MTFAESVTSENGHAYLNKTKIICTIGPKTQSVEMLGQLIEAGMDVMRLNFSHGTHAYHAQTITNLRTYLASCRHPKVIAILLDTKGPEIRTGKLVGGSDIRLKAGQPFIFYSDPEVVGDVRGVGQSYMDLHVAVQPGDTILVDDGLISFRVEGTGIEHLEYDKPVDSSTDSELLENSENLDIFDTSSANSKSSSNFGPKSNAKSNFKSVGVVYTTILNDGILGETKGVNVPGVSIDLPAMTAKDEADIRFGIALGVDFIAASFIRRASDVMAIKALLGSSGIQVIAKIENQEGLDNVAAIIEASDSIMVARGDLGVEIPVEQVCREQKRIIRLCNSAGKPCITATQMLESMIVNPRPTRAEATDVANAVLDGTDAVMLSGETAKGAYPVKAVAMMAAICREAEADIDYTEVYAGLRRHILPPLPVSEAIAAAAVKTAWDVHAPLIIALTESGSTARAICKYRPIPPVIAVTAKPTVARQTQILRGIYPFLTETMQGTENVIVKAMLYGVQLGLTEKGDNVVLTAGHIEAVAGSTNLMKVAPCIGFDV